MSEKFYEFIASQINSFFLTQSSHNILHGAETFCLKLDDANMVRNVKEALENLAKDNNSIGSFSYPCKNREPYHTFTLKVQNNIEIVVAAQLEEVTGDFVGATLRNAANAQRKPLLMITSEPNDSALSSSLSMTAPQMPLNFKNIIVNLKAKIKKSNTLSKVEKVILDFELSRREDDVFSDHTSLYEYKELLSIMENGKIAEENYPALHLFRMENSNIENTNETQLKKDVRRNYELFELINRSLRFGNANIDLIDKFKENFISKLTGEYNKNPDQWSKDFTYSAILSAFEKKQNQIGNPLQINQEDIVVEGDSIQKEFQLNKDYFIRDIGSQTKKKREKNIIIFNPHNESKLYIKIKTNINILSNSIESRSIKFLDEETKKNHAITFVLDNASNTFFQIRISDPNNHIDYVFKGCSLKILSQYLIPTIKTKYKIDFKASQKNCSIKLSDVPNELIFNQNGQSYINVKAENDGKYKCDINTKLALIMDDDELANNGNKVRIKLNFAGVIVPFEIHGDEEKIREITGYAILRAKYSAKSSFSLLPSSSNTTNRVQINSQEYYAKTDLSLELSREKDIIDNHILYGCISDLSDKGFIQAESIEISDNLKAAYFDLLECFSSQKTTPTLAFIGALGIKEAAQKYLHAFENEFSGLQSKQLLSKQQEQALLLGEISVGSDSDQILMTPFHPLNIAYQLALLNESFRDTDLDIVIKKLSSIYLLPYILKNKRVYKVSDKLFSMEWKHYALIENENYMGGRNYVSKLFKDKVKEFVAHFRFIFEDIKNKTININLINMGDCHEILKGIASYYCDAVKKNPDTTDLLEFNVHIYAHDFSKNKFNLLKDQQALMQYLRDYKLNINPGTTMEDLPNILAKKVSCYFYEDDGKCYKYAHLTFYEMESEITSEPTIMSDIPTGASLGGILSGVPSSRYGDNYRTGFGVKYSKETSLEKFAELLNSLYQIGDSGNHFESGVGLATQLNVHEEEKLRNIYEASHWVVFVDPKVDLDFFYNKENPGNLLIIHYSDQYTTSSGYDAITVTIKSQQYANIISEYLKEKGVSPQDKDVEKLINLFNAIDGDWLLRLISPKKTNFESDSTFSREKISIAAAINFMLGYLSHPSILWIPVALEELLRVSKGTGLQQEEGILSAKNLGFENGPTSDDLLFIGLRICENQKIKVYFYPTEVKTGVNPQPVIKKAIQQVSNTAKGFSESLQQVDSEFNNSITYKVDRNFLMQLIINCCKKMQVYHVNDGQPWDLVLDKYREQLLNEEYEVSDDISEVLGKGAVLSFKSEVVCRRNSFKEGYINLIEVPEADEFQLILKPINEIVETLGKDIGLTHLVKNCQLDNLCGDIEKLEITDLEDQNESESPDSDQNVPEKECGGVDSKDSEKEVIPDSALPNKLSNDEPPAVIPKDTDDMEGISIKFGMNRLTGEPVIWRPNDTEQLLHVNTGIIGTMGTGKTQFTKSLITQLVREKKHNIDQLPIGILIFDYKGDYGQGHQDFFKAAEVSEYNLYHLPFNPFALPITKANVVPLLPTHIASSFANTLMRAFGLGEKQRSALQMCIMRAYQQRGIDTKDSQTWKKPAPTFKDVFDIYDQDKKINKNDSLAAVMNQLHDYEIFESDPQKTKSLFDVLKGVVVINLANFDLGVQNLAVAITLNLFYSQMKNMGSSKIVGGRYRQITKLILVDEADNFMSQNFKVLKNILKEGREFGVGTILSTQSLSHFNAGSDNYAKYVLTWVVHAVSDLKPSDIDFVFHTKPKSEEELQILNEVATLAKHNSIAKIGNGDHIALADFPFWKLLGQGKG